MTPSAYPVARSSTPVRGSAPRNLLASLVVAAIVFGLQATGSSASTGDSGHSAPLEAGPAQQVWQQVQRVLPADASEPSCFGPSMAFQKFGFSMDVDGELLAVGLRGSGNNGGDTCLGPGAVYIFERIEGKWVQQAKLDGLDYELRGFGVDVGISGDVLVVGAPYKIVGDSPDELDHGAAFIFEREGDAWVLKAELQDPVLPEGWDYFGKDVAVSGHTVVVGAPSDNSVARSSGSVFVYERSTNGTWERVAHFKGTGPGDVLGNALDIRGNTLFAGSVNRGKVHVYERTATSWAPTQILSGRPGESWGHSVAIDGDVAVVGAVGSRWWGGMEIPAFDVAGVATSYAIGSASIFERTPDGWELAKRLDNPRPKGRERFGQSVAVGEDRVVVTAPDSSPYHNTGGTAYVYEKGSEGWALADAFVGDDTNPFDQFGLAAVITRGSVIISAPFDDNRTDGSRPPLDDVGRLPPCEYQGTNLYFGCGISAGTVYVFEKRSLDQYSHPWIDQYTGSSR